MPEQAYDKVCTKCGERKPLSEYYKKREGRSERLFAHCRDCHQKMGNIWRAANRERVREGDRARRAGPNGDHRRMVEREWAKDHREQSNARRAVHEAVARGELVKPDACEACHAEPGVHNGGSSLLEAHHDDYSRQLDVRWLCWLCHKAHHRGKRAA